jgi:hypothetical protein
MHIKTTMSSHLKPVRLSIAKIKTIGEDVRKENYTLLVGI